MTTDTTLIEKLEDLKRRLASGEYKTLVDVLLDSVGQIIQKLNRSQQAISPWVSSAVIYLVIQLLMFLVLVLMAGIFSFTQYSLTILTEYFLVRLLIGYLSIPVIVVGNIYVHHVFRIFHDKVINAAESLSTLENFEWWLTAICNRKNHVIASITGGTLISYFFIYSYTGGYSTSMDAATTILLLSISNVMFLYLLLYMVVLSERVGWYQLKLNITDPGSSEVIGELTNLLNKFIYLVAIYGAYFILVTLLMGLLISQLIVVIILLFWIPIITMFFLNQNSISSIINKAKWKTLNEIETRIEKIHISKKLGDKATMETINSLMDYYERIKSTRASRVDFNGVLNLVNSLLLPLLALVIGNLDKIVALFSRKP